MWIAWQRTHLSFTREAIAQSVGIGVDTLTLLELGRATVNLASEDQWVGVCLMLTDARYDSDRVIRIVALALGQPILGRVIVLEQVAHDLESLRSGAAADQIAHAPTESNLVATIALLRQSIFAGLDESHLQILARKLTQESFRPRQLIFRQGSSGDALYIIATGQVEVVIETRDGHELRVETPGPGRFFGEFALLDGQPRAATVRTITTTRTLRLQRALFEEVCAEHPIIYRLVAAELARRLRTTNSYVEFFHDYSASERLLMAMRYLEVPPGQQVGDVISYDLTKIRDALAHLPGNTPDVVDRDLISLERLGVITIAPEQMRLNLRTLMRQFV
ncbi:MAG: Crp/Fnr family transcriptional regulator [Oscillochloris sp.]|nr:Crp/Fnr family transcriptional regulator [Oscillochloris sp.]